MNRIAVITGDLVNSALLGKQMLDNLRATLKKRYRATGEIILGMEFFQGDAFQLVCAPQISLHYAVLIRSQLQYYSQTTTDARIAIGIGRADELKTSTSESGGEAFTFSGHMLKEIGDRCLIAYKMADDQITDELNTYTELAETFIGRWTTLQAACVMYALEGHSQTETAHRLEITQPAVSKALHAANYKALQRLLNRYQKLMN